MKYLTALKHNDRQRRGFTLAETLIVVGILAILMALLIPNLIQMQRNLRQKELDAKAEIIYVAAQNELAKLRSGGNAGAFTAQLSAPGGTDDGVRRLASNLSLTTAKKNWLTGVADEMLLSKHWVVVYNANTASVVEVYYSEKTEFGDDFEKYSGKDGPTIQDTFRYKDGANVGYYNGEMLGGSGEAVTSEDLTPYIHVKNGERLVLTLYCSSEGGNGRDLVFTLTMTDEDGDFVDLVFDRGSDTKYSTWSADSDGATVEVTLDDLSYDEKDDRCLRFRSLFGDKLTPGDNLDLVLTVTDSTNPLAYGKARETVNSLFADDTSDGTAYIKCGRHLQNLDKSSGVKAEITHAVQNANIDFGNIDKESEWLKCYKPSKNTVNYFNGKQQGLPKFKPIENDSLNSYVVEKPESSKLTYTIKWLNIGLTSKETNGGLFATVGKNNAVTLRNVILESPFVLASGHSAGALVGTVQGSCTIEGCGVRLETSDYTGAHKKTRSLDWIRGSNVGGLVGTFNGKEASELTITGSYAATLLAGNTAGGLVGKVEKGKLTIGTSYADCYITGRFVGGLVGSGTVSKISNSYAAGYLKTPNQNVGDAAGFVNGAIGTVENSYTVCDLKAKNKVSVANAITAASATYYLRTSTDPAHDSITGIIPITEDVKGSLHTTLNTAAGATAEKPVFRKGAGTPPPAMPYNLDNLGRQRGSYDYPSLAGIQHFGDWLAELRIGSLVYYEVYTTNGTDRIYGFDGADTLRDDLTLVGDGYGVLSTDQLLPSVEVSVDGGGTVDLVRDPLDLLNPYYTVFTAKNTYYIYPLKAEMVNTAPTQAGEGGFWRKASITTLYGTLDYDFNPFLPETSELSIGETPEYPAEISIRSARQLNALSRYYSLYWSDWVPSCLQELDIDYAAYQWKTYFDEKQTTPLAKQEPIGNPFRGQYDGGCHCISHVSFVSNYSGNVGLFGSTVSIIKNIVVAVDYDANALWRVERTSSIGTNQTVNMGVLVGSNHGMISNCAVAGYIFTGSDHQTLATYSDATLHVGGLAGRNTGTIENCSAVITNIQIDATYSTEVSIGGFVGLNNGAIRNSYCLANLFAEGRASAVNLSGFAGSNEGGQINSCYCATSRIASGTVDAYCFSSEGGVLRDNYYLSEGTYALTDILRSYEGGIESQGCKAMTYDEMAGRRWLSPVDKDHSLTHGRTETLEGQDFYPFRGTVTANGAYVHYGDWQIEPLLGEIGVFYWEKETGGSNDGYHISFLGTRHGANDAIQPTSGSTLCTAHDDGGTIVEYGYGYYYDMKFEGSVAFSSDSNIVARSSLSAGTPAQEAKAALQKQINGYIFFPFRTRYSADTGADCLYLTQPKNVSVDTKPVTSGTWTLDFDHDGDGKSDKYQYTVSPFFANAMSRVAGQPLPEGANNTSKKEWDVPGSTKYTAEADRNPYEIRSVEQLQYINWNADKKNCTTLVIDSNRKKFPFLQYAEATGGHAQTRTESETYRPYQFWVQSHDVLGMKTGEDGKLVEVTDYSPIAGKGKSSARNSHDNPLYTWFGGSYDGQSYKIQNLNIKSDSYTVGLFGATAGAEIKNIILYGDGDTVIERDTSLNNGVGDKVGAYQIGGLVGLAYDYGVTTLTPETASTISNCAIAGYRIVDNSRNQHGLGYASIGGLFGISNTNLLGCSAVVDFYINYHSPEGTDVNKIYSEYGNMLRIGGITGTGLFHITDCYSGGHFYFDPDTLDEWPFDYNEAKPETRVTRNHAMLIFVGGIAGSSYTNNIKNFTNDTGKATDGKVTLTNCYTYMELPPMKGNVRSVSIFVGFADRAGNAQNGKATELYTNNCYYLESSVLSGMSVEEWCKTQYQPPVFWLKGSNQEKRRLEWEEVKETLFGNMDAVGTLVLGHGGTNLRVNPLQGEGHQESVSYNNLHNGFQTSGGMLTELGGTWGWVTVTEQSGNNVSGKFSFSSEPSQTGMDYPFPAVVKQDENYVHYGAWPWPDEKPHWELGRGEMDIFTDMKTEGGTDTYAEKIFKLENKTLDATLTNFSGKAYYTCARENADDIVFEISPAGIADPVQVTPGENTLRLTLKPLTEGSVTVKLNVGTQTVGTQTFTFADAAEQTQSFTLENHGVGESATWVDSEIWTSGTQSFRIEPANRASIIKAEPNTDSDNNHYVDVTLRARDTDSVTLTDVNSGAYCNVRIFARLNITTKDSAEADLQQISVTDSDVTFKAYAECYVTESDTAGHAIDYTTNSKGVWSYEPEEMESVSKTNPNIFTVSAEKSTIGDDSVIVVYTYDYHGIQLRATKTLPIRTLGYLGLSDGVGFVSRQRMEDGVGSQTEKAENPGDLRAPQGADIFVFAPSADGDLAQFVLTSTTVTDAGTGETLDESVVKVEYFREDGHPLITQDPLDENAKYSYLGFTVRGEDRLVNISLTFTDPRNNQPVELSLEKVHACRFVVHYNSNAAYAPGATGTMQDTGIFNVTGNELGAMLSDCSFTRKGYRCESWNTAQDGSGTSYELNQEIRTATADITVYAQWEPITYTVRFEPNNWLDDDAVVCLFTYDETKLPRDPTEKTTFVNAEFDENSPESQDNPRMVTVKFKLPEDWAVSFDSWNTASDGSETRYAYSDENTDIMNLTDVQDDEITLYAQWKVRITLSLYDEETGTTQNFPVFTGMQALQNSTENQPYAAPQPQQAGWALDGWYDSPGEGGTKVLDAQGRIAGDCAGITANGRFVMEVDTTLYARWNKERNLTLVNGSTEMGPYTIAAGREIANLSELTGYSAPEITGWTLDGWYASKDAGAAPVFNAGGSVNASASGEGFTVTTVNGTAKLTLTGDLTLYAHWNKTIYTQVDETGVESDKHYLIASGKATNAGTGETTVTLLSSEVSSQLTDNRYKSVGALNNVPVRTGYPWENGTGGAWIDPSDFVVDNVDKTDYLIWKTATSPLSSEATKYCYFTIEKADVIYYLATQTYDSTNEFQMRNSTAINNADNKCSWRYDVSTSDDGTPKYVFQTYWLKEQAGNKNHCVYYESKWKSDVVWSAAKHNTYLFKEELVYTFDPS